MAEIRCVCLDVFALYMFRYATRNKFLLAGKLCDDLGAQSKWLVVHRGRSALAVRAILFRSTSRVAHRVGRRSDP